MASTRRPRALPAYISALLVVCALASSAFAASTFNVNLTTPDADVTGIATDSSSNNGGDVGTANPAVTHLLSGDSIGFTWVTGTHEMEQTNADCSVGACLFAPGFDTTLFTSPHAQVVISTPAVGTYFYACLFHGTAMNGKFFVSSFGALDHFAVIPAAGPYTAGTAFNVTIQARDRNNNVVVGSFSVTMSNPTGSGAVFTSNPVSLVNGVGSTSANIHSSGSQTIHATNGSAVGDAFITVNPAAATHYLVTAPATATAGQNTNFTVTAQDQFNNTATGYAGTVHFTSSDGAAVKPADSTLVSGTKGFGVTFNTPGSQTIVATDTVTGSITGFDTVTVNSANCPAADKTFTNAGAISIPDLSPGSPYPSNITVSGFSGNQVVGKVTVTLLGFNHSFPSDIDIMLVGPGGQKLVLMSDAVANGIPKTPVDITFDDTATQAIPLNTSALAAGTYLPTAYSNFRTPTFNPPAPAAPWPTPQTEGTATLANTFNGINPNGTWSLYIQDNVGGDFGAVNGGWKLTITPGFSASNSNSISFNTAPSASPYPSNINVSGLIGNVNTVTVTLKNLNDTCIPDLALLLVGPQGQKFVPMGFVGNCFVTNANFTLVLDDAAPSLMPSYPGSLAAGTYRPSSYEVINGFNHAPPSFPGAPGLPYQLPAADGSATFTGTFGGIDPNGTWGLYVLPQFNTDSGSFSSGWTLTFTLKCPSSTSCNVGSSQNPTSFLQSTTFTAAVTSGAGTPFGTVNFLDGVTTIASNVALDGTGHAGFTTSGLSVGSHNISVAFNANTTFDTSSSSPVAQVVNKANTITSLVSSVNPTTFNQSTTFTATVTGAFGGTPTGTITFSDNGTPLATQAVNGSRQATLTIQTLAVGNHPITAVYNGDGSFNLTVSNTVSQVVNKASTTSVVVSSVNPSTFGQAIVFTGTVNSTNGIVPTGTVTFFDGATAIASNVGLNGSAQASSGLISNLITGGHNITIVYSGDGNFTGSTSPIVAQTVNKASTTVAVSSSANPSTFGVAVTLAGTVSITAPGGGTPTGTITFKDGATTLGTGAVQPNKKATITTSALLPAAHSITAAYGGDSNFNASPTSPVFTQNVNQASTITTLSVSRTTVFFRQKINLSANVASSSGAPLAGTVTFTDNGKVVGMVAPDGAGNASLPGIILGTLGNHTIVATYGGDPNQTGSSSDDSGTTANVQQSPHPATPNQP